MTDLHNLYTPHRIATDLSGDTATITFQNSREFDHPDGAAEQVTFTCTGNVRIAFNDLADWPMVLRENCVEIGYVEIGYFDANCGWGEVLDEDLAAANGCDGLQFWFDGGLVLRIRCDEAVLSLAYQPRLRVVSSTP